MHGIWKAACCPKCLSLGSNPALLRRILRATIGNILQRRGFRTAAQAGGVHLLTLQELRAHAQRQALELTKLKTCFQRYRSSHTVTDAATARASILLADVGY